MSRATLIGAAILTAQSAAAADLRPMATLHGPLVRISDLFEDAGTKADRVLGPAPAPGQRIVVEARQLAAIARQFGVPWRPETGAERAVLERPGRPMPRARLIPALSRALAAAGAPEDAELDIPAFDPPIVAIEDDGEPLVTHLDYEAATGRFSALLQLAQSGGEPQSWRVSGRAVPIAEVPVAAERLMPGTVLREADVRLARMPASRVPPGAAHALADVLGKQVRYQAAPGAPLMLSALSVPVLVQRNGRVLIEAARPGLMLSVEGRALESGAAGEHVRVLNPLSRAVLDAEVIAEGRVRVDPEAPPLSLPRSGAPEYGR